MNYEQESKMLLKKRYENEKKIRKKYEKNVFGDSLDGSPEGFEIKKNDEWCIKELKRLKEKYNKQ